MSHRKKRGRETKQSAAGAALTPSSGGRTTGKAVSKQGNNAKQQSRSKKQRRGCEFKAHKLLQQYTVAPATPVAAVDSEAASGNADAATGTPSRGGGKTASTSRRQRPGRTGAGGGAGGGAGAGATASAEAATRRAQSGAAHASTASATSGKSTKTAAPPKHQYKLEGITSEMVRSAGDITILQDDHMPFLNRDHEIATMAWTLATNAVRLRARATSRNLRMVSLPVSSQMFGSGKTAMGRNFIAQLGNMSDEEIAKQAGDQTLNKDVKEELGYLRSAATISLRVDATVADTVAQLRDLLGLRPVDRSLATALREARTTKELHDKSLFIHFDEAGTLKKEAMWELQSHICAALSYMHFNYERDNKCPRVHFYFTGRGGSLVSFGKSPRQSPVRTQRIVLTQLQPEHVGAIRETLTRDGGLDLHVNKPGGLLPSLYNDFDEEVHRATAGVPRLILFTMRAVHHLLALHPHKVHLDSKGGITAAMRQVYLQFKARDILDPEITGGGVTRPKFGLLWLWLQQVATLEAWIDPRQRLPFDFFKGTTATLDSMLGDVPFFAAADHGYKIRLGRASFADMAAREGIIKTIGSHAADAVHDWRLLEARVAGLLRLMVAVAAHSEQTWGAACFVLEHTTVPAAVREEHVYVPGCGMLAPAVTLAGSAKEQQAELVKQLATRPTGTVVEVAADNVVAVIGGSFNLFVHCNKAKPGTKMQLSGETLVATVQHAVELGKAVPHKRHVLVVCSTQPLDDALQELLKTPPNPRSEEKPRHAMAVLNEGKHRVGKGKELLHIPAGWTMIVLGEAASRHLSSLGAAALQFVKVKEELQARAEKRGSGSR